MTRVCMVTAALLCALAATSGGASARGGHGGHGGGRGGGRGGGHGGHNFDRGGYVDRGGPGRNPACDPLSAALGACRTYGAAR